MLAFVEYLRDVKITSAPITKLYNLCLPFCALASTALKSTEEPQVKEVNQVRGPKRPRTTTNNQPQEQYDLEMGSTQPQHQIAESGQQIIPQQSFNAASGEKNDDVGFNLDDSFFAQFMDFQPRLQWLDTDFSAFEETWGQAGFGGFGQDGIGYPDFQ